MNPSVEVQTFVAQDNVEIKCLADPGDNYLAPVGQTSSATITIVGPIEPVSNNGEFETIQQGNPLRITQTAAVSVDGTYVYYNALSTDFPTPGNYLIQFLITITGKTYSTARFMINVQSRL